MNYLPTYALSLGLSSRLGSLTLVMVNLAGILGCIIVGALVDRMDVTTILFGISLGAAVAIFAVWGVSTSLALLCVFGVIYGLTASGYSTAWTSMIKDVQRQTSTADANVVFGFLAAGRGLGATLSGPLSEALIRSDTSLRHSSEAGYGGEYRALIIFSGCTAFAGGCSWAIRKAGLI